MKHLLHVAFLHHPHALAHQLSQNSGNPRVLATSGLATLSYRSAVKFYLFKLWLSQQSKTRLASAFAFAAVLPALFFLGTFLTPSSLRYSFATDNCVFNPTLLPQTVRYSSDASFVLSSTPRMSLANYPLLSSHTCVELANIPPADQIMTAKTLQLTALGVLNKNITVSMDELPKPTLLQTASEEVSPTDTLKFALNQPDTTFLYSLHIDELQNDCVSDVSSLTCELENFNLTQGESYNFELIRELNGSNLPAEQGSLQIRNPLQIADSSILAGATIFDTPEHIILTTDKPLKSDNQKIELTYDESTQHPISATISENELTIAFDEPLLRQKTYSLKISSLTAIDDSYLPEVYTLDFVTSGGPKVLSSSIATYNVSSSSSFTLTFDSPLSDAPNMADFVQLSVPGNQLPARVTSRGHKLTITPSQNLPACTTFRITLADTIPNLHGVIGGSEWSMSARTTCRVAFSIGASVQGRSITAHRFGNGATKILIVGGMHGDEKSSVRTLNAFIDDLERNYPSIPADKTVVVIPDSNPDGFVASTRVNANNVDLNRNFPTNDWTTEAYLPRNVFLPNGGGITPLSEPESSALASYTSSLSPLVTLTFHATGRAVFSNGSGASASYSALYAQKSGFANLSQADEATFFSYPTTGEYENWIHDKLGLPALLIELASIGNNEYTRQKPALWAMLGL